MVNSTVKMHCGTDSFHSLLSLGDLELKVYYGFTSEFEL